MLAVILLADPQRDGKGKTVSSCIVCSLQRDHTATDDYGYVVLLAEVDFHYQSDSNGSYFETAKLTDEYIKQKGAPDKPFKPGAW